VIRVDDLERVILPTDGLVDNFSDIFRVQECMIVLADKIFHKKRPQNIQFSSFLEENSPALELHSVNRFFVDAYSHKGGNDRGEHERQDDFIVTPVNSKMMMIAVIGACVAAATTAPIPTREYAPGEEKDEGK
jgi:hypothetical protein